MTVNKKNRGFTTVELAMVIIIFGMVMVTVMTAFTLYNMQQNKVLTEEAFETSEAGLLAFQARFGRYPCPAGPTTPRGNAQYGREQRNAGTGECLQTAGVIEATANGIDYDTGAAGDDKVMIGSVPFDSMLDPNNDGNFIDGIRDIPLRDGLTYDGFGHRLTYAVSKKLTTVAGYNDFHGAITVVDENDSPLVVEKEDVNDNGLLDPGEDDNGNGALDIGKYAHFVLISHGDNGRGAYNPNGAVTEACPAVLPVAVFPAIASAVNELENCEPSPADSKFLSGLRYDSDHSYNDDTVKYVINEASGLWTYTGGSTNKIRNTNTGYVGFGTPTPAEQLDVNGNLRSEFIRSNEYCNDGGTAGCLLPEALGGNITDMECPAGEVVASIENNSVICAPAFSGGFTPRTCPANCYASGFIRDSGGNTTLICRNKLDTDIICP